MQFCSKTSYLGWKYIFPFKFACWTSVPWKTTEDNLWKHFVGRIDNSDRSVVLIFQLVILFVYWAYNSLFPLHSQTMNISRYRQVTSSIRPIFISSTPIPSFPTALLFLSCLITCSTSPSSVVPLNPFLLLYWCSTSALFRWSSKCCFHNYSNTFWLAAVEFLVELSHILRTIEQLHFFALQLFQAEKWILFWRNLLLNNVFRPRWFLECIENCMTEIKGKKLSIYM